MHQDPRWQRRRPMRPGLFAARQVYVRSGPSSRYVSLSRPLQISVAGAMALGLLWLGLASYAAVAKHLETLEQGRELARLESLARSLQSTVEEVRESEEIENDGSTAAELMAKLEAAEAGRARALTLADAAAAEAAELRREVELAQERIGELAEALAQATADREPILDRIASVAVAANGRADGLEIAGPGFEQQACLPP
jgi:hypothetical protein